MKVLTRGGRGGDTAGMTNKDEDEGAAGVGRGGAGAARAGESGAGGDAGGDAVEEAGETTAAAVAGGDDSAREPVGAGTLVEVEGDPKPGGGRKRD